MSVPPRVMPVRYSGEAVWFITGASRGFGLQLTKAAFADRDRVVATARNPRSLIEVFSDACGTMLAVPDDF
jgi:NAD(P)-dependent dehydrogenase (short-subunit alcohol dehydrogenase family)